jgi:hypothetical protein
VYSTKRMPGLLKRAPHRGEKLDDRLADLKTVLDHSEQVPAEPRIGAGACPVEQRRDGHRTDGERVRQIGGRREPPKVLVEGGADGILNWNILFQLLVGMPHSGAAGQGHRRRGRPP